VLLELDYTLDSMEPLISSTNSTVQPQQVRRPRENQTETCHPEHFRSICVFQLDRLTWAVTLCFFQTLDFSQLIAARNDGIVLALESALQCES